MCEESKILKHIKTFMRKRTRCCDPGFKASNSASHITHHQHKAVIAIFMYRLEQIVISKYTELTNNRLFITQRYSSYKLTRALITIPKRKANKSHTIKQAKNEYYPSL